MYIITNPNNSAAALTKNSQIKMDPLYLNFPADFTEPVGKQTGVATKIWKELLENDFEDKNMVFSPICIHILLSLLSSGKKGNELKQFLSFLNSDSVDHLNDLAYHIRTRILSEPRNPNSYREDYPRLSLANGLWFNDRVQQQYFQMVNQGSYHAHVKQVDLAHAERVRSEVNSWVKKETKGLIQEIASDSVIDGTQTLVCANSLYLSSHWADHKHLVSSLESDNFFLTDGSKCRVPYLCCWTLGEYRYFKDDCEVFRIPYQSFVRRSDGQAEWGTPNIWISFLLPAFDELPSLINQVCSDPSFFKLRLKCCPTRGSSEYWPLGKIPQFKISSLFDVSTVLRKLKVPIASTETILHGSVIDIQEQGTATTSVRPEHDSAHLREPSNASVATVTHRFVANRPFLFVIREETTETVLFMGQVLDPRQN